MGRTMGRDAADRIEAVLFDLDGTLLDTGPLIIRTFQDVLRAELGLEVAAADLLAHFGKTLAATFAAFAPDPALVPRLVERYRARNAELHDAMARPVPGAAAAVRALRACGRLLAVVTSKRRATARRGLDLLGLADAVPVVVAYEDVSAHKPDPEGVLLALARLGVPARRAIMLGDTPADIVAARRAGVLAAAVAWTLVPPDLLAAAQPDVVIRTWEQLLALVGCGDAASAPG